MHLEDQKTLNARVINDYVERAVLRRETAVDLFEKGAYVDSIRDSRTAVDMMTMAVMLHAGMRVPPEAVASDKLAPDHVKNVAGIDLLLSKERALSELAASGSRVVLSDYFTAEDARSAMRMADNIINLFSHSLRNELGNERSPPSPPSQHRRP